MERFNITCTSLKKNNMQSKLKYMVPLIGICLICSCSKRLFMTEFSDEIFDAQATYNDHIKNMVLKGTQSSLPELYFTYNEIKYLHEVRSQAFHGLKNMNLYKNLTDTIYVLEGISVIDSKLIRSNIWGMDFNIYYSNFEISQGHRKLNVGINDISNNEILGVTFNRRWQKMKEDLKIGNIGQIRAKSSSNPALDGDRIIGLVLIKEKGKYVIKLGVTFEEF